MVTDFDGKRKTVTMQVVYPEFCYQSLRFSSLNLAHSVSTCLSLSVSLLVGSFAPKWVPPVHSTLTFGVIKMQVIIELITITEEIVCDG